MPLYTVMTQAGVLDDAAKADLAARLTSTHSEISGVPKNWVHVIFLDYPERSGFTAGVPAPAASLTLVIRTGRSSEYKRDLLRRLWALLQAATQAPDDQIVIGIQEVAASQAMEMGEIMPEVSNTLSGESQ